MNKLACNNQHNKNNHQTLKAVLLLGASLLMLQACSSSGSGDDDGESNNNTDLPIATLSAASANEGNTGSSNLDFTVALDKVSDVDISVAYTTSDGSATAGEDYTVTTGTLTIPANSISSVISVPIIGDTNIEIDENFNLEISNAQNATISNNTQSVIGSIITDDTLAGYYTGSASVNEGGGTLTINAGDIRVIADAGTLAITDLNTNLIYIVTLSDISNTDFTASARIYKDGDFVRSTNITATFIAGNSITLTLSGTGDYTTGTITLTYSAKNAVAPLVFADGDVWQDGNLGSITANMIFNSNTNTNITTTSNVPSSTIGLCRADGVNLVSVLSEQMGRIRSFSALVEACVQASLNNTILSGYMTTYDEMAADDRVLFIWFNDESAHAAGITEL